MGKVTTVLCGLKMSLVRHLCKLTRFTITFCKYMYVAAHNIQGVAEGHLQNSTTTH